jgi:hypothetical protein
VTGLIDPDPNVQDRLWLQVWWGKNGGGEKMVWSGLDGILIRIRKDSFFGLTRAYRSESLNVQDRLWLQVLVGNKVIGYWVCILKRIRIELWCLHVTGLIDPDPNVQDRLWLQVLVEGEKVESGLDWILIRIRKDYFRSDPDPNIRYKTVSGCRFYGF